MSHIDKMSEIILLFRFLFTVKKLNGEFLFIIFDYKEQQNNQL